MLLSWGGVQQHIIVNACQLCLVPVLIVTMTSNSKNISASMNTSTSNNTSTITSSKNCNIHHTSGFKSDDDSNHGLRSRHGARIA